MKKILSLLLVIVCLFSFISFAFAEETAKICISEAFLISDGMADTLKLLSSELGAALGTAALPIDCTSPSACPSGSVVIVEDAAVPEGGFTVSVSSGVTTISASGREGVINGIRYITKQYLCGNTPTDTALTPAVTERALFLDIGRKYYTPSWIKSTIKEISFLGMNTLVLHFSEEMGLGIESKLYPWLNGRDGTLCVPAECYSDNRVLSQDKLKEIIAFADTCGVKIIPSFDSPGHMNYIVKKFNEKAASGSFTFTSGGETYTVPNGKDIGNYFHYNGKTAIVQGSRNKDYSRGIDISDEIAREFTKSLLGEYAALFYECGSEAIDIGGDELLGWGASLASVSKWKQLDHWKAYAQTVTGNSKAVGYDGFLLWMNELYDFVTDIGYTSVRMWNDDALRSADTGWTGVVKLNKNIDIEYWTADANSKKNKTATYTSAGHGLYNYLNYYNYYVLGKPMSTYGGVNVSSIWNEWTPTRFSSDGTDTAAAKGYAFCVWADSPLAVTEQQVFSDIYPLLMAQSAKAWNENITAQYDSFEDYAATQPGTYASVFPSLPAAPEVVLPKEQSLAKKIINGFWAFVKRVLEILKSIFRFV